MELSLFGAFLGGILTLLSPCSVMLLPAFFAYAFTSSGELLARTAVFFAGLAISLVPLGMLAGSLGAWVNTFRFELVTVASIVVIVLGLTMAVGVPMRGMFAARGAANASNLSVLALGAVYGLAGVCAGPMLGAALTFAAFGANPLLGGMILLVFAVGMVVPLIVLALLWNRVPAVQRLVQPREVVIGRWRNTWTNVIGGLLTAGVGALLLVTRGTTALGGVLGATDQARLESSLMSVTSSVPNWFTLLVFVFLGAVWVAIVVRARHARRASR